MGRGLRLLYYDRSVILESGPLDVSQDHVGFVGVLAYFRSLSSGQWGRQRDLFPLIKDPSAIKEGHYHSFLGETLRLVGAESARELKLDKTIHRQHGLIGRGTCVVAATETTIDGETKFAVKLSYPATTRLNEAKLLKGARDFATKGGSAHSWVLEHLPNVVHHEDLKPSDPDIEKRLGKFYPDYELRVLRVIVEDWLEPIDILDEEEDLKAVYRDIFKCIFAGYPISLS